MEIYNRLPDELQRIVKKYAICSPHKQLLRNNTRRYTYSPCSRLLCFHNNNITELMEVRRRIIFNSNTKLHISCKTLLWHYYELNSKDSLIQFIQHNTTKHERNWLCRQHFGQFFTKLNVPQLIWLRLYVYYTV